MNDRLQMWRLGLLLALAGKLTMANPLSTAVAGEHYESYSGVATVRHSNEFLYGEHHVLRYRDGRLAERVVLYTCRDGSAFARKTVAYVDPLAPDFLLEDASNGMRQGVRDGEGGRTVFFRGDAAQPEKTGPLPQTQDLVADTGFDEFIHSNWRQLMTGKSVDLHFLVPGRLEELNFQAQRVRSDRWAGVSVEVIRLKPAGVLGWVLTGIDASYSSQDRVLMRYQGLTDLRDASGNNYQAEISFPSSDRSPAGELQSAEARQAQLTACKIS